MIATFRSRIGLWSIRLGILVPALMAGGLPLFDLSGCVLGLNHPGGCSYIPDAVGDGLLIIGVLGVYASISVTPVMVVSGLVLEMLARHAGRRGGSGDDSDTPGAD